MKYAYYPGCSLHATAKPYDMSVKKVCATLGIDLWEIPDWTCCGASSAHSVDELLSFALPAKTLVSAEKEGLDIVAPCAACWQRLQRTNVEVQQNQKMKEDISTVIGEEVKGTSKVLSIMEVVQAAGVDKISAMVQKPLAGVKVACYYGCYYVKPPKMCHVDHPENPVIIDQMMTALGAEALDWPFKTECCGASLIFVDKDTTLTLSKKVLDMAVKSGADLIVTACPVCEMNLDMRQSQINKKFQTKFDIPVLYFTQLMALAFGATPEEIGLGKNYVSAEKIINKI